MATQKRFQAVLETEANSTFTFITIPFDAKEVFGTGRPSVRVTLNGYEYRSTLAPYGGVHYLGVNQTVRSAAQVKAGDTVTVMLQLDVEPRAIKAPADFTRALKANPAAQARWQQLSFTHQKEYVAAIEGAKKPETRARRMAKAIDRLAGEYHTREKKV
jgi:hypothetical protein